MNLETVLSELLGKKVVVGFIESDKTDPKYIKGKLVAIASDFIVLDVNMKKRLIRYSNVIEIKERD